MRLDDGLLQIGRALAPVDASGLPGAGRPDWVQADPRFIERALARAQAREGGGWVVVDASANVNRTPRRVRLVGRDWVLWRSDAGAHLAPDACPHMGAALHDAKVDAGCLVCPWHGLRLGPEGRGAWRPAVTFDDGWLLWARLLDAEQPTDAPLLPARPAHALGAVVRMEARCEPQDIVANRLDPWHGAHYHPHSFARLDVLEVDEEVLRLRVSYRVVGRVCVEVDATFHAPTRRSIVMTIVDGDGMGSVVETHASPVEAGRDPRTAVVEATLAASDRRGFSLARRLAPLARPFIEARARRLWVEDCAYAERRYVLRGEGERPLSTTQTARSTERSDRRRPRSEG